MTKSPRPSDPSFLLSEQETYFRFAPIRIRGPHSLRCLAQQIEATQQVLRDYVTEAFREKFLPEEAVVAQFVSVPPINDLKVAFDVPAIVRDNVPAWQDYVRGFCVPLYFSTQPEGLSFHAQVADKLNVPAGTIVVFTTHQSQPEENLFPGCNLIWVQIEEVSSRRIPALAEDTVMAASVQLGDGFTSVQLDTLVKNPSHAKALSASLDPSHRATVGLFPMARLSEAERGRLTQFVMELFGGLGSVPLNHYLAHVARAIRQGPVMVAAPKKVYFEQPLLAPGEANPSRLIDSSGITVIFKQGSDFAFEHLQNVYRVAHRLSTAFSSLYGVAQVAAQYERQEGALEAFGMAYHSVKNAYQWMPTHDLRSLSIVRLEQWVLEAAELLVTNNSRPRREQILWRQAGIDGECLEFTFIRALAMDGKQLILECSCLHDLPTEPRLVALLLEVARNSIIHSFSGAARIVVKPSVVENSVNLQVYSDCRYTTMTALQRPPREESSRKKEGRGFQFVLRLTESLSSARHTKINVHIGHRNQTTSNKFPLDLRGKNWLFIHGSGPEDAHRKDLIDACFPYYAEYLNLKLL